MRDGLRNPAAIAALVTGISLAASAGIAPPAVAAAPVAADTLRLDLAMCLESALAQAPVLEAAAAASVESRAAQAEATARQRPILGAAGAYQYTSEHMRRDLELGVGLPTRTLEFGDGHMADLNLGLAVPLYTGGELTRAAAAAAAGAEAASRREDGARLDVIRGVRQTFSSTLGRQAQVDAAGLAVARLSRHLDTVTGAEAVGAATGEAVVRTQARLSQARQRLFQAEAARDSAALALGRLVGRPGSAVLPRGAVAASLLIATDDTTAAVPSRPDLAALELEAQRQRELAAAANGRLLPRVMADLRAHYGRPGVDALANEWMGYGTAGVSVDWPLWDSGARRQRAGQAAARARWLDAQHRELDEAITTAEATARSALRSTAAQEAQCGEREALQGRLLEMVAGRYELASATETEYLDAHDDLAQAELDLALARTRVRLAEAFLLWTLGR